MGDQFLRIVGLARARVDTDPARHRAGVVAGVLQCVPGALQQDAVLGVEGGRLGG